MAFEDFARHLSAQASPVTVGGYVRDLHQFAVWFEHTNGEPLEPERVTPSDVREYRNWLQRRGLRAATVNRRLAAQLMVLDLMPDPSLAWSHHRLQTFAPGISQVQPLTAHPDAYDEGKAPLPPPGKEGPAVKPPIQNQGSALKQVLQPFYGLLDLLILRTGLLLQGAGGKGPPSTGQYPTPQGNPQEQHPEPPSGTTPLLFGRQPAHIGRLPGLRPLDFRFDSD